MGARTDTASRHQETMTAGCVAETRRWEEIAESLRTDGQDKDEVENAKAARAAGLVRQNEQTEALGTMRIEIILTSMNAMPRHAFTQREPVGDCLQS